jgi:hypothetical protein
MSAPDRSSSPRLSRRAVLRAGVAAASAAAAGLVVASSPLGRGSQRPSGAIDTLDYFLRNQPGGLTGSHLLAQSIDHAGRRSFYIKGDSARYEVHTWDDDYIYLVLDRDPERVYGLAPGIWMARTMAIGDELVAPSDSRIAWYSGACAPQRSAPYSYTVKLEQRLPAYDIGGDLGRQEVIVLRYLPAGGRAERFYYSRAWGWIAWEEYDDYGHIKHRTTFNRIIRGSVEPSLRAACAQLIAR